jgi:enoyl-CoA hydratase/carnithine racemase
MKKEYIFMQTDDDVAVVTINRPPLNALHSEAYAELYETFYELSKEDRIKVVILTGYGKKAFVAGADVKEFLDLNRKSGPLYTRRNNSVREYIRQFSKPVICAVNGIAYGGGLALALVCDIRIAVEHASFNLGEINMGILGATQYVARVAHMGSARKLVYTGDALDPAEALRVGIVDEIVPADRLMERSMELARKIASKSPLAIRAAKRCMVKAQQFSLEDGLQFEESVLAELWGSDDKNEAVKAFLEKRKPVFTGR